MSFIFYSRVLIRIYFFAGKVVGGVSTCLLVCFIFTLLAESVLMKFLSKTFSRAGSSSSPTSSIRRGLPKERLSSK